MKTTTKSKEITREQLSQAVEILADHHRGRQVLASLLALFRNGADALDMFNQQAVMTILAAKFGPFAGSTTEAIKSALGNDESDGENAGLKLSLEMDLSGDKFNAEGTELIREVLNDLCERLPDPLRSTGGKINIQDFQGEHIGTAEIR